MNAPDRAISWCLAAEGSTRAVALLRIFLASIVLIRYGQEVAFFATGDAPHTLLAIIFFMLTPVMLLGAYTRLVVPLVALMLAVMYFLFGFLPDKVGWNHHHSYILMISVFFLSFTPCGRSYSIDRLRDLVEAERDGRAPLAEHGPLWATRLIGLQISALYFWTAVDKTDWAFLSGQRLEQIMVWHYAGSVLEPLVMIPLVLMAASVIVVAVEYVLPFAIHLRRVQWIAIPAAIAMHAVFYIMLPVETYSITMIVLYVVVVDANAVHRFLDRLQGHDTAQHRL